MSRWPSVVVGLAVMLIGLTLATPFLVASWRYEVVQGRLRGVYQQPVDEHRARLVFHFAYPVRGPVPGLEQADVEAFGSGRCDRSGRPLPPLVLDTAAANALTDGFSLRGQGDDEGKGTVRSHVVYYDPADPFASARICLQTSMWRFELGLMMLITPLLAWLGFAIAAAGRRRSVTIRRRSNPS